MSSKETRIYDYLHIHGLHDYLSLFLLVIKLVYS